MNGQRKRCRRRRPAGCGTTETCLGYERTKSALQETKWRRTISAEEGSFSLRVAPLWTATTITAESGKGGAAPGRLDNIIIVVRRRRINTRIDVCAVVEVAPSTYSSTVLGRIIILSDQDLIFQGLHLRPCVRLCASLCGCLVVGGAGQ